MDDIFGLNPCPKNQATFNWCLVGVSIHSAWVWRSFTYCFIITRYFGRCLKAFDVVFSTEQSCLWAGSSLHFTVTLLLLCEVFYDSYVQISTPSDNILSHAWTKIGQLLQSKLKSNLILIICFLYIIRELLKNWDYNKSNLTVWLVTLIPILKVGMVVRSQHYRCMNVIWML